MADYKGKKWVLKDTGWINQPISPTLFCDELLSEFKSKVETIVTNIHLH